MAIGLLIVIILLVSAATFASKGLEKIALKKDYRWHRFYALVLLFSLLAIVGVLEWLLRAGILVFSVSIWLYFIHVTAAVTFLLLFFAKWLTASQSRRDLHIRLSKFYWFFWKITASTAVIVGIQNVL